MDILAEEFAYPIPFAKKSLVFLVFKLLLSLRTQKHSPDTTSRFRVEYDYIVVGSGPGGATVAARLSELPFINILLLEAGNSAPVLTEVPVISRSYVGTDLDWGYKTSPQRFSGESMINRQVVLPSGKAIGGSSIFSNLMYVRGSPIGYNQWKEMGAVGWGYEDILPYFKKSEMNRNPESVDIPYHGFHGPMTVERPVYTSPYKSAIEAAVYELGHAPVDVNGRYFKGFYDYQANIRYGQRCSAAKAYLVPAENRRNLDIVKNAFVTKIPVVADLPVGNNLHDHGGTHQMYYSDELSPFSEEIIDPQNIMLYIRNRSGILSAPIGRLYMPFFNNHEPSSPRTLPDYELLIQDFSAKPSMATSFNMRPEVYKQWYQPYENKSLLLCVPVTINPRSRGNVRLRSANPYDSPAIDPNYLADPRDLSAIIGVKGVKGLRVADASVMPKIPCGHTYAPTLMVAEKAADMIKRDIFCP